MENIKFELKIPFDKKIGVLCGGLSSEREVSLRSGKNCLEALKRLGYKNAEIVDVDRNIAQTLLEKKIDVAYIALHGKYGEDGCIQGLLEILDIPYSGSGVMANAIGMNKEYTKKILKTANIPVITSVIVSSAEEIESIKNKLSYPLMIKPVSEGSSIGMTKVETQEKLTEAFAEAQNFNQEVMLEDYIEGKSLTVGVLDIEGKTIATPVLEFRTKTGWYDYESKYTEGLTEFILPANISEETANIIKKHAVNSHLAIGAFGMSRVDFILSQDNKPYVLEINTIPGMTDLSDLPAQSKEMGISFDNLVGIILNSAVKTKEIKKSPTLSANVK